MSSLASNSRIRLGDISPARSRHAGRRSAVSMTADAVFVGTAAGEVRSFGRDTGEQQWVAPANDRPSTTTDTQVAVVALEQCGDVVVAGERSSDGAIRCYDRTTGERRWRYETATDIGEPQKATRFFLPFVVDIESDGKVVYVASRRYERQADERSFTSIVYAFHPSGECLWQYETDASPISIDVDGDLVAIAYNRCPGDHQAGVVVLDSDTGREAYSWDPPGGGQRRVGDVSLLPDGLAVASHADYRGYRLEDTGTVRWQVDLARPREIGDERLYAYPNHVHATGDGICFVTGNTYAEEGRETDGLHPNEHTVFGFSPVGELEWQDSTGGFATGVATDGTLIAIPAAQHFRTRDPTVHGVAVFDVPSGRTTRVDTSGVVTATALQSRTVAALEEPVRYHDGDQTRGTYSLHLHNYDTE